MSPARIYTIGHSTRSFDELLGLLREHAIGVLADIRRYPGSRRYPHFSRDALSVSLPEHDIEYIHMPELGGRRKPLPDSPNTAWRNEQFRAYADYMASEEFLEAVDRLMMIADGFEADGGPPELPLAIMCAEAVPWRCHRNLVADELVGRGVEVVHIIGHDSVKRHEMNPHARSEGGHLVYPAEQSELRL